MTKTDPTKTGTAKPVDNKTLAAASSEAAKTKPDTEPAAKTDEGTTLDASKLSQDSLEDTKIDGEDHGEPETVDDAIADSLDAAFGGTTSINDPELATAKDIAQVKSGIDHLIDHSAKYSQAHESAAKIEKLVGLMDGTKSEYILYGYGGVTLTLGDLRNIVGG